MDYLLSLLNRLVGNEELARLLFVGAIGLSAVLVMVTLAMLVLGLRDRYRCIVPDHVGMGLSDRPDDAAHAQPRYDYTLQARVDDLAALLDHEIDCHMLLQIIKRAW